MAAKAMADWEGEWSADAKLLQVHGEGTSVSKSARGLGALQDASRGWRIAKAGNRADR